MISWNWRNRNCSGKINLLYAMYFPKHFKYLHQIYRSFVKVTQMLVFIVNHLKLKSESIIRMRNHELFSHNEYIVTSRYVFKQQIRTYISVTKYIWMGVSHIYNRSVNAKVISSLTHMKLISDSYVYTIISDKFCV